MTAGMSTFPLQTRNKDTTTRTTPTIPILSATYSCGVAPVAPYHQHHSCRGDARRMEDNSDRGREEADDTGSVSPRGSFLFPKRVPSHRRREVNPSHGLVTVVSGEVSDVALVPTPSPGEKRILAPPPTCRFHRSELLRCLERSRFGANRMAYRAFFLPRTRSYPRCRYCGSLIGDHSDTHETDVRLIAAAVGGLLPNPVHRMRDPTFRGRVLDHYGTSQCVFLQQRFRTTYESSCTAAHLYDHRMQIGAKTFGIDVDDARNGLPMFPQLEEEYDRGNVAIVALSVGEDNATLQLLVCSGLKNTLLQRRTNTGHATLMVGGHAIKFGMLHGEEVRVRSPDLRALLLKQRMAHMIHPTEFPRPRASLLDSEDPGDVNVRAFLDLLR